MLTAPLRTRSSFALACFLAAAMMPVAAQNSTPRAAPRQLAADTQTLSSEEEADLKFIREEEKLARDVYTELYKLWPLDIFKSIQTSEETHFSAIGTLLDHYNVSDPADPDVPGQFKDPDLQALYDQLVKQGSASLKAALEVGVLIEETDIEDLTTDLTHTRKKDIAKVYANLLDGSYNHLEAFQSHLDALALEH